MAPRRLPAALGSAYRDLLGRGPRWSERRRTRKALRHGHDDDEIIESLARSTEHSLYLIVEVFREPVEDDAEFVHRAYRRILGRAPDDEGLAWFVDRLQRRATRLEVVHTLLGSDEAVQVAIARQHAVVDLRAGADPAGISEQVPTRA